MSQCQGHAKQQERDETDLLAVLERCQYMAQVAKTDAMRSTLLGAIREIKSLKEQLENCQILMARIENARNEALAALEASK